MMTEQYVTTSVTPLENLNSLSPYEIDQLQDASQGGLYRLFRQCCLAVLNSGSELDSTKQVLDRFSKFDIRISQKHRSVQLELVNAPATAFVNGEIITGIREHLFAVLRDLCTSKPSWTPVVRVPTILKRSPIWCFTFCATPTRSGPT